MLLSMFRPLASFSVRGRFIPSTSRLLSTAFSPEDIEAEEKRFREVFEGNRKWVQTVNNESPGLFEELAKEQKPRYLYIGCSDSRVPAQEMTGLSQGDIFVHRNISNLVVNTDLSMLSVLKFAVEHLKIRQIIVCGHYGCGGVKASMSPTSVGLLDNWLRNIRDVHRLHFQELQTLDAEERFRRLVELNVKEQCFNLFKTDIVQRRLRETGGLPLIHGLVYDLKNGSLKELDTGLNEYIDNYRSIYEFTDVGESK